jgi:gliding motility-associated-like protein
MIKYYKIFVTICVCFICLLAKSQGAIKLKKTDCLGDVTAFSFIPSSGLSLVSASWDFGDGFTSISNTPVHTYKYTGVFKVKITALLSNGNTAVDSQQIQIVGLPKASFYLKLYSDSCLGLGRNKICFEDTSRPNVSTQNIIQRYFTWGDGNIDNSNSPLFGAVLCHTYTIADKYTINMEIIDNLGCKSKTSQTINILETTEAKFDLTNSFVDCKNVKVCIVNKSSGKNYLKAKYTWKIDTSAIDTNKYFSTSKCIQYQSSRNKLKTTLIVDNRNNCIDSITKFIDVVNESLPSQLSLSTDKVCIKSKNMITALIPNVGWDKIIWKIDNIIMPWSNTLSYFQFYPTAVGTQTVTCEIIRGKCTTTLSRNYTVSGPIANFTLIDNNQCNTNREVFMYDDSKFINKNATKYKWTINDINGDKCTSHREKGINKYTNCNISLDWYNKHTFTAKGKYKVKYEIVDTITGCKDSLIKDVLMDDCPILLTKDSFDICQGDVFYNFFLRKSPKYYSLDTGKTWKNYPITNTSKMLGTFTVGYIFETRLSPWAENYGSDSIKIHTDTLSIFDTIFKYNQLRIKIVKKDNVSYKIYGNCRDFRISVFFSDGNMKNGEAHQIFWPDGTADVFSYSQNTKVDSISKIMATNYLKDDLKVNIVSTSGCKFQQSFKINKGKLIQISVKKNVCFGDSVCMVPIVVFSYNVTGTWKTNTPRNRVEWIFSDVSTKSTQFAPCHQFKAYGMNYLKAIAIDSFGCSDTLKDSVFVQKVTAGIANTDKAIYCAELKQFFDSSSLLKNPNFNDRIVNYDWDFGSGKFSSPVKDPYKAINSSSEYVNIIHAVKSLSGCTDTVQNKIKIIGAKPYFRIKDTIGCGSLNALFWNLSKNCKSYIWEFGDTSNSTYETSSKDDVSFLYKRKGRYNIHLIGIDTILNPVTGKVYYCNAIFPDKNYHKDSSRAVWVLPVKPTGIKSIDTVCVGTQVKFSSLSDTSYKIDNWFVNDSGVASNKVPYNLNYTFKDGGLFNVKLKPKYFNPIYNVCADSAQKQIYVIDVKANFDIDSKINGPLFQFYNKSTPSFASLNWNFGQPITGANNESNEQNPQHHHGFDTGRYKVCLIATIPFGCSDTVCKPIISDKLVGFAIFNVFTPGNNDAMNDQYDIIIEGEDYYDLHIYDRWGVLVFHGEQDADNTQQINWNGKYLNKGPDCSSGTYYYIFKYRLKQESEIKMINGTVTLIRE